MGIGRSSRIVAKEKLQINLARLKKGGETFEVILRDPEKAFEFKRGKNIPINEIIEIDNIFKDAKKGLLQSEENIKKWFGTDNKLEAAKIILKKGDVHLTADVRRKIIEQKKAKIIDYIHMNAFDPKTRLPHPPQRIELAMDEAKVRIDPQLPIESQLKDIIKKLRTVLPLSFEKIKLRITIPARYSGSAYGKIKSKFELLNENWRADGSVEFELEIPAGIRAEAYNFINSLTNGEAIIEEL